jgi:hypothetical protein
MELPTCPACGQSVLDDDADECPFCGASMSGKPIATATKPVPAAAPAARPQPMKSAASSPAAQARRPAQAPSEQKVASDDPFELERTAEAKKKVVQLRQKPEPGRRHEVKCPMCETVGYTGRKAAGMDVKCANPGCRFPLFTAPPLDDADEEPAETASQDADSEPAKKSLVTRERIIAYSLIGVVSIFALWFFAFREPSRPKSIGNPSGPNGGPRPRGDVLSTTKTDVPVKITKSLVVDPRKELLAIRKAALKMMVTQSGMTNPLSPLKASAWQLTVDAHARAGDLGGAKEQMEQLRVVTSTGTFYQALPHVAIAWQHLERGGPDDFKAAAKALDDALAAAADLASRLRPGDRRRYDVATGLAAALYAAGRDKEAETLLAANGDANDAAQASLFAQSVRFVEQYDAEAALRNRRVGGVQSPQRVAVTLLLAGHGRWNQAWAWAKSQSAGAVRDECITAWSEMRFPTAVAGQIPPAKKDGKSDARDPDALPGLDEAAALLSGATARGTLYARIAFRLHDRSHAAAAAAAIAKARTALEAVKAEAEPKTPAIKDVFDYRLPSDPETRRATAGALAELARAELRLDPGTGKAAWSALSRGLDVARSIAPSPVDIAGMVENLKVPKDRAVRAELTRLTGLAGGALDEKFTDYRLRLAPINSASKSRIEIETRLLVAAANWGGDAKSKSPEFLRLIWNDVEARTRKSSAVGPEDWYATRIPWLLQGNAKIAGDTQLAADIHAKIGQRRHHSRKQIVWDPFQTAMRRNEFDTAAKAMSHKWLDPHWVNGIVLAAVSRFADAGDLTSGKSFIRSLKDPLLQMEALDLLAARASVRGKVIDVWAAAQDEALHPPQKVGLCHGLVVAMPIPSPAPAKKNP